MITPTICQECKYYKTLMPNECYKYCENCKLIPMNKVTITTKQTEEEMPQWFWWSLLVVGLLLLAIQAVITGGWLR